MNTIVKYIIFAVIATAINIGTQELSIRAYTGSYFIMVSILAGTATGLVSKYLLDKKFIFYHRTTGLAHDGRVFFWYTLMGIITTLIFWLTEYGFHWFFETKSMRYLGAVLGLAIGYWMKYHLDKRFVFTQNR